MTLDYDQFHGKPFQVISKLQVRYTGIFDHIDQSTQTICLAEVFNHGTEDRPCERKFPGKEQTLGWVRFHTDSIESLALTNPPAAPAPPVEEEPVDPILASVSAAPPHVSTWVAEQSRSPPQPQPSSSTSYALPSKPRPSNAQSAATALDRVQQSLSTMRHQPPPPRPVLAPEAPDREFDFAASNEAFEKERQNVNVKGKGKDDESAESTAAPMAPAPSVAVRNPPKKSSFFDNLSSESHRVSRMDERHRNLDTFGEAGSAEGAR
ncbi:protein LSM14, partial [Tremellales sp. Uapishka_1]